LKKHRIEIGNEIEENVVKNHQKKKFLLLNQFQVLVLDFFWELKLKLFGPAHLF